MAYADLLDNEAARSHYLCVLQPARKVTGFAVDTGSQYSVSFDFGQVTEVTQDGVALTEAASSTALAAGEFFFDVITNVLYVRMSDSSDPSTKTVVGVYEFYVGSTEAHLNRVPTDTSTRDVYFDPIISKEPEIKASQSQGFLGFIKTERSNITLMNAEHTLEKHIYDSSFFRRKIDVYHVLDDTLPGKAMKFKTENIKKVLSGRMGDISYNEKDVTIEVSDEVDTFDAEYRNADTSFWAASDFTELDPNFQGRAIRYVYGRVAGFVPVNLDYKPSDQSPTTSDNRVWGVRADKTKTNEVTRTVAAGSTTTVINLADTSGLRAGDGIRFTKTTPESAVIASIITDTSITLVSALGSGAPIAGNTLLRPTICKVSIVQDSVRYDALPIRDFTVNTGLSNDVLGFTLTSSAESNLGMASTLSPNDSLHCVVYGPENTITLGGPAFGSDSAVTTNLTAPAPILVDLLVNRLGLGEDAINNASFTALNAKTTEDLSFAIPAQASQDFPTYKALLIQLIQSVSFRFFINDDNEFEVYRIDPLGAEDKTTDNEEILKDSFSVRFGYKDLISDARVEYAFREVGEEPGSSGSSTEVETVTSDTAKFLHGVSKQKTFKSLHLTSAGASALAGRMAAIFGDRKGMASVNVKNRFYNQSIADVLLVQRTKAPGFEFDADTVRDRKYAVISVNKGLRQVRLELDDQQAVEDNSGLF